MKILITLTFLICLSFMGLNQKSHPKFDSLANELISNTTIPSVVMSYITSDTCLYGIAGINNINDKKEIQLTDKFSLGSNTKAITSLIAMKMVEREQISLDTKLLDMAPDLKKEIKHNYRKITLGELLSHRAHVRAYMYEPDFKDFPEELTRWSTPLPHWPTTEESESQYVLVLLDIPTLMLIELSTSQTFDPTSVSNTSAVVGLFDG